MTGHCAHQLPTPAVTDRCSAKSDMKSFFYQIGSTWGRTEQLFSKTNSEKVLRKICRMGPRVGRSSNTRGAASCCVGIFSSSCSHGILELPILIYDLKVFRYIQVFLESFSPIEWEKLRVSRRRLGLGRLPGMEDRRRIQFRRQQRTNCALAFKINLPVGAP